MPRPGSSQDGFTLVEVMVAVSILLIGVLGTVTMIDGANALTGRTKAREGGTALARSVLEIARGIPYRELTANRLLDELEGRAGMADASPGAAGHQIASRGFAYTVTPTICTMDDPKDNLGEHDEIGVVFCSDTDTVGVGGSTRDRNADDYRRVTVDLSWNDIPSHTDTVRQLGVVTNPVGGLGPSVTSLTPKDPPTDEIVSTESTPTYDVTTSAPAESVGWLVGGARRGEADDDGNGTDWTFEWNLGPVDTPAFVDCTYVLQAEAFDEKGRAGASKALVITLNRRRPFAPTGFAGGRNLNNGGGAHRVDLQWSPNQECDIDGYEVYRGTAPNAVNDRVCEIEVGQPTECVDLTAPPAQAGVTLYYQVLALDTKPDGTVGVGDRSAPLPINESNAGPPSTPTGVSICTGGSPGCFDIDGELAPSNSPVLSWQPSTDQAPGQVAFYRVYRDGQAYDDRLDILFPVPNKPLVFIDATATGSHSYRVSAVDNLFGESQLSDEVTWP
jgi:prepilin-type N-terminal cleavage/methylation domain-containing protein